VRSDIVDVSQFKNPEYLRLYYAGHAVAGILAKVGVVAGSGEDHLRAVAKTAFAIADAMVKEAGLCK